MTIWIEVGGAKRKVEISADGEFQVDGRVVEAEACELQPGVVSIILDGRQHRCLLDGEAVLMDGRRHSFEVSDPRSLKSRKGAGAGADGPRAVKAPMPGRVVRVLVGPGEPVVEQQGIVVIEAMKMQNELKSPKAGVVGKVSVAVGDTVGAGDVLAVVE